jgi:acid stress-induced BolA-like protein IbaG/YrbA
VISETFQAKSDRDRQRLIWDALTAELGDQSVQQVGTVLAYTPREWNVELPERVA